MTITVLNDDCLIKIFELLELDECLNVAETCKRFADVMEFIFHGKFASLKSTSKMQDDNYIDRVFDHVGKHLKCVTVGSNDKSGYLLAKASHCENVKTLFIRRLKLTPKRFLSQSTDFQYVESLSLNDCSLGYKTADDFLSTFRNVKNVNMTNCCAVQYKPLKKFFKKNNNIENCIFVCKSFNKFQLNTLKLVPKLERLYFHGIVDSYKSLKPLSQLKSLKKLKLTTNHYKNDNFRDALLKLNFLEELEIEGFRIDESAFSSLKNFHKLQLLRLTFRAHERSTWMSTFNLPTNIKSLKLEKIFISENQIATIISDLPMLESFHINAHPCSITVGSHSKIDDFDKIAQRISAQKLGHNSQIVNVILVNEKYSLEEFRVGRLRILGKHPNNCSFGIDFSNY